MSTLPGPEALDETFKRHSTCLTVAQKHLGDSAIPKSLELWRADGAAGHLAHEAQFAEGATVGGYCFRTRVGYTNFGWRQGYDYPYDVQWDDCVNRDG